jgi:hypothetical protein
MKTIFYQYSSLKELEPISGDRITELMTISAMEKAGMRVIFGGKPTKFDGSEVAYIRASEKYFDRMKGIPRIWFASPYNYRCMKECDRIATFSDAWTDRLRMGMKFNLNPDGIAWVDKVVTIPQTIAGAFFNFSHINTSGSELHPNICLTGRLVTSTHPTTFMNNWPEIKAMTGGKLFLICNKIETDLFIPKDANQTRVDHKDMPCELSLMDLMIAGQHGDEWEFCGNMKILEAAAVGVPIIMERSTAREEDFGFDYPFFVPRGTMTNLDMAPVLFQVIKRWKQFPNAATPYLKLAANRHKIETTSQKIQIIIDKI